MLNWKAQVKWQSYLTYSGKITDNMTGITHLTVLDGVKKEVLSTFAWEPFLRVKPFQVWTSLKPATFDLSLKFDQQEGEIALQICLNRRGKPQRNRNLEICHDSMDVFLPSWRLRPQGVTAKTKNGTLVGVYSTKAHPLENPGLLIDVTCAIEFYEDHYGVKYPILSIFISLFQISFRSDGKLGLGNLPWSSTF